MSCICPLLYITVYTNKKERSIRQDTELLATFLKVFIQSEKQLTADIST